ncbi:Cell division protein FtsX [Pseudonocardia sp. Ae168_Ps1]|uniref:permease-like cell division protein FtsX n=1 Tax=unclassified Pseudonocardia TaxID=2619320 RepID=UPI00094AE862|nr:MULTISPECIES: permease-like cell division protein FtsX [unclassified Pseudonocardia]OLL75892.1 Cell division protein FtsX [Pseudonocardia sp. Ae150A_Ps1]OLL81890.1 Cell division protein FtsX [Pseudonocardia sp. Ae168_Ps1]OLL83997.1 Cell division protein FtsX [Pseudonocardia sp. Ae263_Ps1]OLL95983.1 Cell division protein FtsX [Pseudonocardia sp. Ae356_Ps1]
MRPALLTREVSGGLRRNVTMTLAMVLTTAVTLMSVGAGLLVLRTIDDISALYADRLEIQVALTPDVSGTDADCSGPTCASLRAALESAPGVGGVAFESQQQAYERFRELFAGQSVADVARPQSLPATLRVSLTDQQGGAAAATAAVEGRPGVRGVIDQRDVVGTLFDFLDGVRNVAFALAIVQAIAAVLLISNTVQVSAFTRRTEVGVMRLVGATRWTTQLPFLVEAAIAGAVGGALAGAGLVAAKFAVVDDLLAAIGQAGVIPPVRLTDVALVAVLLVPTGAVVAGVTGYVTLRAYVKV